MRFFLPLFATAGLAHSAVFYITTIDTANPLSGTQNLSYDFEIFDDDGADLCDSLGKQDGSCILLPKDSIPGASCTTNDDGQVRYHGANPYWVNNPLKATFNKVDDGFNLQEGTIEIPGSLVTVQTDSRCTVYKCHDGGPSSTRAFGGYKCQLNF